MDGGNERTTGPWNRLEVIADNKGLLEITGDWRQRIRDRYCAAE